MNTLCTYKIKLSSIRQPWINHTLKQLRRHICNKDSVDLYNQSPVVMTEVYVTVLAKTHLVRTKTEFNFIAAF